MIAAAVLLGVAANVDNLTIGLAYGTLQRRIRLFHNALIAVITTTVTFAAMMIGELLHQQILSILPNWISGAMLILFALAGLIRPQVRQSTKVTSAGVAGLREVVFLATVLSVNNIGLAVAGGFAGMPYGIALAAVFCFSIALLAAGQIAGQRASLHMRAALSQIWIGNLILLGAGVMILLGI